jgi:methionyl-tRNA formyltransferase
VTQGARPIRVVFFGTPAYAVPALRALASDPRFVIALVVTQPDRPAGRGRTLKAPAVKAAAESMGLPIYQPESLRSPEARVPLEEAEADLFVVAAYGLIFGKKTLCIPARGCLNLHASLLPEYRGASPVTAAILQGDPETGVTLMRMEQGLDTGDIIATASIPVLPDDTTGTLTGRLAVTGAELAVDAIPRWLDGEIKETPQPAGATIVRPLIKADGWIDWSGSAEAIERQIRAMQPWPRAWTTTAAGETMQVLSAEVVDGDERAAGTLHMMGKNVVVACGRGELQLRRVQLAGSAETDANSLVQGRRLADGDLLGAVGAPDPPPPLIAPA